jgi:hypothetical protein
MASSTPNLSLRKPTNADLVNVATDLSENFDKIDAHVTSPTAHSGTYVPVGRLVFDVKDYGAVGNAVTDDTTAIQAAINAAGAAGGGTVYLPPGTYIIGKLRLKAKTHLRGSGRASVFRAKSNLNDNLIVLDDPATVEQVELSDFGIEGNRTNQTSGHGIYLENTATPGAPFASGFTNPRHELRNLFIRYVKGDGIHLVAGAYAGGLRLSNIESYSCDGYGFYIASHDSAFTACDAGQSGLDGFRIEGNNNRFANCKGWRSGRVTPSAGFFVRSRNELVGCEAQDNLAHGFYILSADLVTTAGLTADTNAGNGVTMENATNCLVDVVAFDRGGDSGTDPVVQQFGVGFVGTCVKNIVHIVPGSLGSSAYNHAYYSTDNIIMSTETQFYNRLPHSDAQHVDSRRTHRGTTQRIESMDRALAQASAALVNGTVQLTYLTAPVDLTIGKLFAIVRGTAAVTPTLARLGLYTVAANGDLTLVARTASDTALFNATFTLFERSLSTTGGYPATYALTAGSVYAVAQIVVGAATLPALYSANVPGVAATWDPVLCQTRTGQTDLPTSMTAASLAGASTLIYCGAYA